ncbi:MAG: type II secretion system protein [Thermodesulfovibrionia bacterium]|nr:type II secretion system protein [Thermodesulfovibrionia bacterium]
MTYKQRKNSEFTLTELMIAVVLTGLIATFGIPSYTKSFNRTKEKDAIANLELIREAVRLHMSREGGVPPDLANVGAINTTLYLNILEQNGKAYSCTATNIYTCLATNADGWTARFRLSINNGAVDCGAGTCPTL